MNLRTTATLEKLQNADWFDCVGKKDTTAATVLLSWQEAFAHCSSVEWENLSLEAVNQYCERLVERSKKNFRDMTALPNHLLRDWLSLVVLGVGARNGGTGGRGQGLRSHRTGGLRPPSGRRPARR